MPSTITSNPRIGSSGPDDLDKLLDYDNAVEEFMRDLPPPNQDRNNDFAADDMSKDIDGEIKIKKQRKSNPKLDEARLLSDTGIPKLRKITRQRLKFKGKGHEFSDISTLLNTYQLWLDDLYPRAKFRDALAMVEKVGHSKRMQVTRRAWLEETKGGERREDQESGRREGDVTMMSGALGDDAVKGGDEMFRDSVAHGQNAEIDAGAKRQANAPDTDELDTLLVDSTSVVQPARAQPSKAVSQRAPFEEEEPAEDELDDLLAEGTTETPVPCPPALALTRANGKLGTHRGPFEDEGPCEDELDALLMEEITSGMGHAAGHRKSAAVAMTRRDDEFTDDEAAMAEMNDLW